MAREVAGEHMLAFGRDTRPRYEVLDTGLCTGNEIHREPQQCTCHSANNKAGRKRVHHNVLRSAMFIASFCFNIRIRAGIKVSSQDGNVSLCFEE